MDGKAVALLLVVVVLAGCTATTDNFNCVTSTESEYNDGVLTVDVAVDVTDEAPGRSFDQIRVNTVLVGDGEALRTSSKQLPERGPREYTETFVLNETDYTNLQATCSVDSVEA